jgi:hypothetical protein
LSGEPVLLSADGDDRSTVSLAMKDGMTDHGAAAYSVNPAGMRQGIRFQGLDEVGKPIGTSRPLNSNLEHANGVGITTSIGGFVIAYRATSDLLWDFARIRVTFLGDTGNRVGDGAADIIEASDHGGAPTLTTSLDGRIVLSWFDDDEAGNRTLKVLRYPCNR